MAPKTGPSLRELMKNRNKAPSPQDKNKSKPPVNPPPQLPADLGLKPSPDLRGKRPTEATEEGDMGPSKGSKQPRQSQDQRSRRSNSVDSREEPLVAQVRRPTRPWSPKLEVDGVPIAMMPPLGIIAGGTMVWWLRLWSSHSSSQRTWRLIGTSTIQNSFYPLKGTWLW